MKSAALWYAEKRGWPVFPAAPGSKRPLTQNGFHDASVDPAQIEKWWDKWPDANVAIPTGAVSGLVVIDVDRKDGRDGAEAYINLGLPETLAINTPTGGMHAYFRHPGVEVRNRANWLPGIDIRGDGGYVIAPPSVVGDTPYTLRCRADPADIPAAILANLANPAPNLAGVARKAGGKISPGSRNDHLAKLAGMLASQGYDQTAILAAVRAENAQQLDPPLPDDEIEATVAKSAAHWAEAGARNEPEVLRRLVPPPGEYPLAALGNILGPAAQRVADVVMAPAALCGQALLAAASLAVQAHADVLIDGRREPLSLWMVSVAESGERKSAADDVALAAHREHEIIEADIFRGEKVTFEAETAAHDSRKKTATKKRDALDIEGALRDLGPAPEPPLLPWILVSSPTIEGLHKLYKDGQPSLGLLHDDGGEFLGGHSMAPEHRMKTASGLSKLWDRGEFDRVRGGDGSEKAFGKRLALHLMIQPVVAETILSDSMLTGQGFLARCLLAWPSSKIGTRKYAGLDLAADPAMVRYRQAMARLLTRQPSMRRGTRNELEPRALTLGPGAREHWITLHDDIEYAMREGGEYSGVRAWASKAPAQILRVAGVLTLVSDPDAGVIQAGTIEQAAAIVVHALDEAVRIIGTASVPVEIQHAQALLEWCHRARITMLHSGAALQFGPNPIRTKVAFDKAMRELEKAGWAVPVSGGAEIDGRRRRRVWEIRR